MMKAGGRGDERTQLFERRWLFGHTAVLRMDDFQPKGTPPDLTKTADTGATSEPILL